jgi:CubicO group peptidase (beta-lactamase class C family)
MSSRNRLLPFPKTGPVRSSDPPKLQIQIPLGFKSHPATFRGCYPRPSRRILVLPHLNERNDLDHMGDVEGHVAPGFEKVRDAIAARDAPWGRCGGSVAAYVDGTLVVDLWGGDARPGQPWREDTLSPVASVTKSWAAVVIGKLFEQGVVDWTTPICTWWPEFAHQGKGSVTLNEIFAHSSGVLSFDNAVEMLDANDCQGWLDLDGIAAALAVSTPSWTPGTRNGYHAVSYGWLLNEVVRRTTGRTIGETFATDFAKPLELDTHIGTHGSDIDRCAYGRWRICRRRLACSEWRCNQ